MEGLIAKSEQKHFVDSHKRLLMIETGLEALKHIAPTEFSNFINDQHKKPFEQRWAELGHLSGVNFEKYLSLAEKENALYRRMQFADPAKLQELLKHGSPFKKDLHAEAQRLSAEIKGKVGARFANPFNVRRLSEFMRLGIKREDLSRRDVEKLHRNIEALKKKEAAHPIVNRKRKWHK